MAPISVSVILRVFGVLFLGMLVNTHFFQNGQREGQIARLDAQKPEQGVSEALVETASRTPSDEWRARLRRQGLPPALGMTDSGAQIAAKAPEPPKARADLLPQPQNQEKPLESVRPDHAPQGAATGETPSRPASKLTRAVQRELTSQGYEPGPVDGVEGLMTHAAIMAFQYDNGVAPTGRPTEALLKQIILGGPSHAQPDTETEKGVENRRRVIKTVQLKLRELGYKAGAATGVMDEETRAAIREFEKYSGLVATGRVSGRLIGKLSNVPRLRVGAALN